MFGNPPGVVTTKKVGDGVGVGIRVQVGTGVQVGGTGMVVQVGTGVQVGCGVLVVVGVGGWGVTIFRTVKLLRSCALFSTRNPRSGWLETTRLLVWNVPPEG